MGKFILFSIGVLLSTVIFAQSPESFSYQAIVRDNSGQPLPNTSVTFQFNILQTSASGTLIYSEEQTTTTNDFGLVNLKIGEGVVQSGIFSTIDWSSDTYFLNIQIDQGSGFVDMGTQQFISVPYALFAKSAGNGGTTYTAGNGISITGNIIENTAPDQIVNITGSGATTVSGTYPNFTVSSTDNVDDADADSNNEIQDISLSNTDLSITDGSTVDLSVIQDGYEANTDSQTLSVSGNQLTISNGNTVTLTDNVNDADADSTNELQTLSVTGNQLSISGSSGNTVTMQVGAAGNNGDVQFNDNGSFGSNADLNWNDMKENLIIGQDTSDGRLVIRQDPNSPDSIPILEVKNKAGQTIFVVYPDSVHIFIDDDNTKGVLKGGFAVSGRSGTKAVTNDFLLVRPDSTRIYVADSTAGFGVGNIEGIVNNSIMKLTTENYFIGHESGNLITSGLYNSFLGYQSGLSTSTGGNNVFIGYNSGYSNTGGGNGVFIGTEAGYTNMATWQDTYIGYKAGYSISGSSNTIIGSLAGSDGGGSNNIFIGTSAGKYATDGNNTFIGNGAGAGNMSAHVTGRFNTTLGEAAGGYLTSGEGNTIIGRNSGYLTYEGSYNTFLGLDAGRQCRGGSGNVYIGYTVASEQTDWQGKSNRLAIDNSNGDSTDVLIYGEFDNDILKFNTHSTWVKHQNGYPTNGFFIDNTNNTDYWSFYQYSTGTLHLIFNGADRGNWNTITGAYTSVSDRRLKKNFENLSNILQKVDLLQPQKFNFKTQKNGEQKYIGFIAQDIKDLFPSLVSYNDESDLYMVDYAGFSVVAIQAIKEQQKIIKQLQKEIISFKLKNQEIEEIKNRLEKIENSN